MTDQNGVTEISEYIKMLDASITYLKAKGEFGEHDIAINKLMNEKEEYVKRMLLGQKYTIPF